MARLCYLDTALPFVCALLVFVFVFLCLVFFLCVLAEEGALSTKKQRAKIACVCVHGCAIFRACVFFDQKKKRLLVVS